MQTFNQSLIQSQIRTSSLTARRQNYKSLSLSQYTSEDEISRQIRFDPQVQQLDFMLKKRTSKNKNIQQTLESKFYNPFEFKIKTYQMVNVKVIPIKEKGKRKPLTSYRRQQTFKGREKSLQTQWQRISQEFSDTYM